VAELLEEKLFLIDTEKLAKKLDEMFRENTYYTHDVVKECGLKRNQKIIHTEYKWDERYEKKHHVDFYLVETKNKALVPRIEYLVFPVIQEEPVLAFSDKDSSAICFKSATIKLRSFKLDVGGEKEIATLNILHDAKEQLVKQGFKFK
jgi:hypothetical protein